MQKQRQIYQSYESWRSMGDFTFWLDFRWANSLSESLVQVPT